MKMVIVLLVVAILFCSHQQVVTAREVVVDAANNVSRLEILSSRPRTPPLSFPKGRCGNQAAGRPCPTGQCCSKWGWCGTTPDYCSPYNCQSQCVTPSPPPPSFPWYRCGKQAAGQSCPSGQCCSRYGYCGTTPDYCSPGKCQSQCVTPSPPPPSFPWYRCGKQAAGQSCPSGQCCSRYGYCGTTPDYCSPGKCQSQCVTPSPPPSPSPPPPPPPSPPPPPTPFSGCSASDKEKVKKCMFNTTSIDECCPTFKSILGTKCPCYQYAEDLDNQVLITLEAYCDVDSPCRGVPSPPPPDPFSGCSASEKEQVKTCMFNTTSIDECCPIFKKTLGTKCPCYKYADYLDNQVLITLESYCDIDTPCKSLQVI